MADILIPQELANILIAVIIAVTGGDIVKWFMHEMNLDNNKKEGRKARVRLPFIAKVRIFVAETLLHIGNLFKSLSSKVRP